MIKNNTKLLKFLSKILITNFQISILFFLSCSVLFAEDKFKVALLPIKYSNIDKITADQYQTAFLGTLQKKYIVISGDAVESALKDYNKREFCVSTKCLEEITYTLNCDYIARASVQKNDADYMISIEIRDAIKNQDMGSKVTSCEKCSSAKVFNTIKNMFLEDDKKQTNEDVLGAKPESKYVSDLGIHLGFNSISSLWELEDFQGKKYSSEDTNCEVGEIKLFLGYKDGLFTGIGFASLDPSQSGDQGAQFDFQMGLGSFYLGFNMNNNSSNKYTYLFYREANIQTALEYHYNANLNGQETNININANTIKSIGKGGGIGFWYVGNNDDKTYTLRSFVFEISFLDHKIGNETEKIYYNSQNTSINNQFDLKAKSFSMISLYWGLAF